ncbi:hypothetical protein RIF29_34434 [Crotalaria pallida]|uniref:Hydroxyproline-rich glycoprotein family protein n=1 Tax=Crotalaria pallida TaxID=3830 RepID=A0AAN9E9D8_CROPI
MMRGRGTTNGENGRGVNNNTLDTINAAASVIASSQNRVSPQPTLQKKRWGSWLNISGCFGYHKNRKRIGHATLVPEPPAPPGSDPSAAVSSTQPPTITLPFVAPPSSPASLFQSEPPSVAQSPVGILSLKSVSASMYSPSGPASIFAIGPYAHEPQLVSPPVFSAFTTEPSTAPVTPPPESVHLTTPSSPEVPFAQLLDPNNRNGDTFQRFQISHYDFQSYQFHPGSPLGQLISPRSAISASGTASPLPDYEFTTVDASKLLNLDKLTAYEKQKSNQCSGSITPDAVRSPTQAGFLQNHWVSEVKMSPHPRNNQQNEISINHRVSFEISAQKVLRCLDNKPATSAWTNVLSKLKNEASTTPDKEENSRETGLEGKQPVTETLNDASQATLGGDEAKAHEKFQSLTHSSAKEFNFDNADGVDSCAPSIVPDWWANEKVAGKEGGASNKWSFFPMVQPGVS